MVAVKIKAVKRSLVKLPCIKTMLKHSKNNVQKKKKNQTKKQHISCFGGALWVIDLSFFLDQIAIQGGHGYS